MIFVYSMFNFIAITIAIPHALTDTARTANARTTGGILTTAPVLICIPTDIRHLAILLVSIQKRPFERCSNDRYTLRKTNVFVRKLGKQAHSTQISCLAAGYASSPLRRSLAPGPIPPILHPSRLRRQDPYPPTLHFFRLWRQDHTPLPFQRIR